MDPPQPEEQPAAVTAPQQQQQQQPPERHFTARSVAAGLGVGAVICSANIYFGLQTGWISIMSMPASLMGFGIFRLLREHLVLPFTPVENVLLQSVAGGMAVMPLGCGFVGVIPAMTYLLKPEEQGPVSLSVPQLIVWALGLCYFGVVFAVPLRRQVIIRERLRFPSGFSTAVLISFLHDQDGRRQDKQLLNAAARGEFASLVPRKRPLSPSRITNAPRPIQDGSNNPQQPDTSGRAGDMRLLLLSFLLSGVFTIFTYFFPAIRNIPIFGALAAQSWLWTLNPSLAYVGQGIIMGCETTLHMLLGAIFGWAVLSPLAKFKGWAPGSIDDWEHGSKGWIVWVSLAIMLVDAVVSLGWVALRSLYGPALASVSKSLNWSSGRNPWVWRPSKRYTLLPARDQAEDQVRASFDTADAHRTDEYGNKDEHEDAPPQHRVGNKMVVVGLSASIVLCLLTTHFVFGSLVPLYATILALLMALLLSIMGVRALGETDLNPVSGISKLAQLFFALFVPNSKASVLINLVGGAISEAGALQAGDLMQDLKTGHLLGAAPKAQFWGQIIGATVGAVFSALVYHLYTLVYKIPGDLFGVPTAYVWIFTARLVTGQGLPPKAKEWAIGAGAIFACTTLLRLFSADKSWRSWIPGGIAVAVGMYNVPSFTLARAVGGILSWYWITIQKRAQAPLIILASGFILGEGFLSIVNLVLQSFQVPHF